ncbi:MAG: hypothetical protein ACLFOY_15315 [Desulfatibacillaceae bacterium]
MSEGFCTRHTLSDFADCYGLYDPKNAVCACWCALRLSCSLELSREDSLEILEDIFDVAYVPKTVQ